MEARLRFWLIAGGLLIVFAILLALLSFSGYLQFINQPINRLVAGSPDKGCTADSDCVLKKTRCMVCDCGDAVNKDWEAFCPIPAYARILCKLCPSPGYDFSVKCMGGECQRVWNISSVSG